MPGLVGVVTIPFKVRRLYTDRLGVLSLGLFMVFQFLRLGFGAGLQPSYVAEALGKSKSAEGQILNIIWAAVTVPIECSRGQAFRRRG